MTKQILSSTSATVYFDNCLVGALVKADHPAEMPALAALMREHAAGRLSVVASTETLCEIERLPSKYQGPHLDVWSQLKRLPAANVSWVDEGSGNCWKHMSSQGCAIEPARRSSRFFRRRAWPGKPELGIK